jgi:hypothetical protein
MVALTSVLKSLFLRPRREHAPVAAPAVSHPNSDRELRALFADPKLLVGVVESALRDAVSRVWSEARAVTRIVSYAISEVELNLKAQDAVFSTAVASGLYGEHTYAANEASLTNLSVGCMRIYHAVPEGSVSGTAETEQSATDSKNNTNNSNIAADEITGSVSLKEASSMLANSASISPPLKSVPSSPQLPPLSIVTVAADITLNSNNNNNNNKSLHRDALILDVPSCSYRSFSFGETEGVPENKFANQECILEPENTHHMWDRR